MKLTIPFLLIIIFLTSIITFWLCHSFDDTAIVFIKPGEYQQLKQMVIEGQQRDEQLARVHDNLVKLLKDKKVIEEGLK